LCPFAAINRAHRNGVSRRVKRSGGNKGQEYMDAEVVSKAGLSRRRKADIAQKSHADTPVSGK